MKTYTKEEIYAMSDDEAERAFDELNNIYFNMFGKECILIPALKTIQDDLEEIADYIRREKPCKWESYDDFNDIDF